MDNSVGGFLRRLRTTTPGCRAAALVDLDTNMVLTDDAQTPVRQELWDALALKAIDLLASEPAQAVADSLSTGDGAYLRSASLRRGDDIFLLFRSAAEPPLGILCICDRAADVETLIDAASEELETLATD